MPQTPRLSEDQRPVTVAACRNNHTKLFRLVLALVTVLTILAASCISWSFFNAQAVSAEITRSVSSDATQAAQITAAESKVRDLKGDLSIQMTRIELKVEKIQDLILKLHKVD